jgi:hypothetical protein
MARVPELLALLILLTGLVFIAQGLGLIRGRSFMVDDLRWAAVGVVMVLAALGLVIAARRRAPRA